MKYRLRRLSTHQTALVVGVAGALSSLLLLPFVLLTALFDPQGVMSGAWVLLLMPLVAFLYGYVATAVWCWFYNLIAGLIGGIELELEPAADAPPAAPPHGEFGATA